MRERIGTLVIVVALATGAAACGGSDDESSEPQDVEIVAEVVSEIGRPTALTTRKGDPSLYVAHQTLGVLAIRGDDLDTVLDLEGQVAEAFWEQGVLGLAFSPDGSTLYVHYNALDDSTQIDAYTMVDDAADPASRRSILTIERFAQKHNGGQLATGPDDMLWIGLGDGSDLGEQSPPEGRAQSVDTLFGKVLRVDPEGGDPYAIPEDNPFATGGGRPEIWAYGLRNPFSFSFDADTGDLWIADVGDSTFEEINFAPAPDRGPGANYGWSYYEGTTEIRPGGPSDVVFPFYGYAWGDDGCAISGGTVVRGSQLDDDAWQPLEGWYLFSDFCAGGLRAVRASGDGEAEAIDLEIAYDDDTDVIEITSITIANGDVYALVRGRGVVRLEPV